MKKIAYTLLSVISMILITSCENDESDDIDVLTPVEETTQITTVTN